MSDAPRNPYEALGEAGVRALVDRFYDAMERRPDAARIRAMHAKNLAPMRERLAVFLVGWMGGPSRYGERFGAVNVPGAHAPFDIGAEERDAWLACMDEALAEVEVPAPMKIRMRELFGQMAEMCRTVEPDGSRRPQFARGA